MSNTLASTSLSMLHPDHLAENIDDDISHHVLSPKPQKRPLRRRDIAFNKDAIEELKNEREISHQIAETYEPTVVVYSNGLLLNQDGEMVSMLDYNLTQYDIDSQLAIQKRDDDMEPDECFIHAKKEPFPPILKLVRGKNVIFKECYHENTVPTDLWATFDAEAYEELMNQFSTDVA